MFLGFDIGSSSVKVSLVKGDSGECLASAFHPKKEMAILAPQSGWAEQSPEAWWANIKLALKEVLETSGADTNEIKAIGISYQMHGLVCVDKSQNVLKNSIIWCDSRAAEIGNKAFENIGAETCLSHLLNSPSNFTASKLKWVKDNEPAVYEKIDKIMLPGDYIAMRLTGIAQTTVSGLSEGIFWDFKKKDVADIVLDEYGFSKDFIPEIVDTFGIQGQIQLSVAKELGLPTHVKVTYRAGDQPNNALSLNVLNPGEVATTAGTSGVVYGVSDKLSYDEKSRVNTFAHVNYTKEQQRLGVLLCINGTGILNSWIHKNVCASQFSYKEMDDMAAGIPIGSDGLVILPFGNGAERVLENKVVGAQFSGINFNRHTTAHIIRASQEGIAFSFAYGMEIMQKTGINANVIRAGKANMFLSPIFRGTLSNISGATVELYNTDGSVGAARGAALGFGYYNSEKEAFEGLKKLDVIEPVAGEVEATQEAYEVWKKELNSKMSS